MSWQRKALEGRFEILREEILEHGTTSPVWFEHQVNALLKVAAGVGCAEYVAEQLVCIRGALAPD